MRRYILILLSLLCACSSLRGPEIQRENVELDGLSAVLFQPRKAAAKAAMVLADPEGGAPELFAARLARSGYAVLCPAPPAMETEIERAFRYMSSERNLPTILFGVGAAGNAALSLASADTTVLGVVTLCAPLHELARPPGSRPLLIIASQEDGPVPADEIERFYRLAAEPKKLVWLASAERGTLLLRSDMEPVIRRVTSMLLETVH